MFHCEVHESKFKFYWKFDVCIFSPESSFTVYKKQKSKNHDISNAS